MVSSAPAVTGLEGSPARPRHDRQAPVGERPEPTADRTKAADASSPAPVEPTARRPRLDSLTSLRYLAASMVVLVHGTTFIPAHPALEPLVQFGYTGVTFFFMLSGFVLFWSRRPGEGREPFYIRRFARIWPIHIVMTLVAIPVLLLAGLPVAWSALPAVFFLLQAWIPDAGTNFAFNGVSWSLSAEAFFYAMFPFLAPLVARLGRRGARMAPLVLFAGLVAVTVLLVDLLPRDSWSYWLYVNPAYRIGEFIIGMALAAATSRGVRCRVSIGGGLLAVAASYAFLVWLAEGEDILVWPFAADLVMLPAFALLIVAAATADLRPVTPAGARVLHRRPFVLLGEASFALYLLHEPALRLTRATVGDPTLLGWGPWPALVGLAVCTVLAIGLHLWVEQPLERAVRSRLLARRAARSAP